MAAAASAMGHHGFIYSVRANVGTVAQYKAQYKYNEGTVYYLFMHNARQTLLQGAFALFFERAVWLALGTMSC